MILVFFEIFVILLIVSLFFLFIIFLSIPLFYILDIFKFQRKKILLLIPVTKFILIFLLITVFFINISFIIKLIIMIFNIILYISLIIFYIYKIRPNFKDYWSGFFYGTVLFAAVCSIIFLFGIIISLFAQGYNIFKEYGF